MLSVQKMARYLTDDRYRFLVNAAAGRYTDMPDEEFIRRKFYAKMGRELNLEDPKTFNEKLNWLKLYYRNPIFPVLADKYRVKQFVADAIGEEYVIPLYGVWDSFDEIDFDSLPEQFVLKCTHDSGGLSICRDRALFDKDAARAKIEKSLRRNYYYVGREWQYKEITPRIIAEAYMEDGKTKELRDYKFFCFDGEVKAMFIATERQSSKPTAFDFFDSEFRHLDVRQGHPNAETVPEKPVNFELMKSLSEKLSAGIPHVRVDFYEVNGRAFFGEMTFFHFDGSTPFDPEEWDWRFGEWLHLPEKTLDDSSALRLG